MIEEKYIVRLLLDLGNRLDDVRTRAFELDLVKNAEKVAHARILQDHEFQGSNAEKRAREAEILLAEDPDAFAVTHDRQLAEMALQEAKDRLEVARESLSMYRALMYQTAGGAK